MASATVACECCPAVHLDLRVHRGAPQNIIRLIYSCYYYRDTPASMPSIVIPNPSSNSFFPLPLVPFDPVVALPTELHYYTFVVHSDPVIFLEVTQAQHSACLMPCYWMQGCRLSCMPSVGPKPRYSIGSRTSLSSLGVSRCLMMDSCVLPRPLSPLASKWNGSAGAWDYVENYG